MLQLTLHAIVSIPRRSIIFGEGHQFFLV
uniref:Uncharacterized protein n=1 Tax=Anguilla anguilla TaxID=7936 RepID=A0A0E9PSD7_ANGAN